MIVGTHEFEALAHLEARNRGLADLPVALVSHPLGGIKEAEVRRKAETIVEAAARAVSLPESEAHRKGAS